MSCQIAAARVHQAARAGLEYAGVQLTSRRGSASAPSRFQGALRGACTQPESTDQTKESRASASLQEAPKHAEHAGTRTSDVGVQLWMWKQGGPNLFHNNAPPPPPPPRRSAAPPLFLHATREIRGASQPDQLPPAAMPLMNVRDKRPILHIHSSPGSARPRAEADWPRSCVKEEKNKTRTHLDAALISAARIRNLFWPQIHLSLWSRSSSCPAAEAPLLLDQNQNKLYPTSTFQIFKSALQ